MIFTDDPIADFNRHDAKQERELKRLPRCSECGEHIQQEDAVFINSFWYCDECLALMREPVGDN